MFCELINNKFMKRIFVSITALIIAANLTFGQDRRFGITIDPQISWMNSDVKDVSTDGSKMGINIGLVMDKYFTKNYAITSGISINNIGGHVKYAKGAVIEGNSGDHILLPNAVAEYKLQYVTVPLGLKLHTNEIGYLRYYAELGFEGHINIKSRINSGDVSNESISESASLFNAGYFIGGGAQYSLGGNAAVFVGINYHQGLMDVIKEKGSENKTTIGAVSLRLGIMF